MLVVDIVCNYCSAKLANRYFLNNTNRLPIR